MSLKRQPERMGDIISRMNFWTKLAKIQLKG